MAYYVYILTNASHRVLYTGVTTDMKRRLAEHKHPNADGFTRRYGVYKLVYCSRVENKQAALLAEQRIKGSSLVQKRALIESENPQWEDLSARWTGEPNVD